MDANGRPVHAITGAFGYCGRHIAALLLEDGLPVRNLTGHPNRPVPFAGVETRPLAFDDPPSLRAALDGVDTLYNTYWVRFEHGDVTFCRAVRNSVLLFGTAAEAGVRRVVHVSITNPDPLSPLPYFRGKAVVETALKRSGLSYAIIRPALFFGGDDVLVNNIAWLLRRFPVFAVAGDGQYLVQPIHVEDFARLAVDLGGGRDRVVVDAVGPEILSFEYLVRLIAAAVGSRARLVHLPSWIVLLLARVFGYVLRDVLLTRDEITGLSDDLLVSGEPPTGTRAFSEWVTGNADDLGRRYASELARHYR
jgi:NADH dehydrogenase